jgi:CRISPR-associated protein Cas5h
VRTLVFDITGEYGQFKKPYSPMSPVSFPFPPPTAVLGMLGAILGLAKDEYHEQLGWRDVHIGVQLLAPVRIFRAALNLLNTKEADPFFRPRADKNTHIQVPCEFLRSPAFRLYVAGLRDDTADELERLLMAGSTVYTPVLGLAHCLAETRWLGEWEATPAGSNTWRADTVIPLHDGMRVHYAPGRRYHRLRVPAAMDGQRVVHRYQEVVVAEDGQPIEGAGRNERFHRVQDATVAFL